MKTSKGLEGASEIGMITWGESSRMCWLLDGVVYSTDASGADVIKHRFHMVNKITLATDASHGLYNGAEERLPPGVVLSDGRNVVHWDGKAERRMVPSTP